MPGTRPQDFVHRRLYTQMIGLQRCDCETQCKRMQMSSEGKKVLRVFGVLEASAVELVNSFIMQQSSKRRQLQDVIESERHKRESLTRNILVLRVC
jgi:flagellar basal body rod protein FlgF